jgi:hypothetical protein
MTLPSLLISEPDGGLSRAPSFAADLVEHQLGVVVELDGKPAQALLALAQAELPNSRKDPIDLALAKFASSPFCNNYARSSVGPVQPRGWT